MDLIIQNEIYWLRETSSRLYNTDICFSLLNWISVTVVHSWRNMIKHNNGLAILFIVNNLIY